MKTIEFLDECKRKLNISTDLQLAQALECGKSRISQYRSGQRKPDVDACFRMAEILNVEPQAVISAVRLEGSSTPAEKTFWERYARQYGMVATFPFVLAGTITLSALAMPAPAQAQVIDKSGSAAVINMYYAK